MRITNEYDHCAARGCDIDVERGEEIYHCQHEDCLNKKLCVGCVFSCADCSEDFCEHHTFDLKHGEGPGALIVCFRCEHKRHDEKRAA